QDQSQSGGQGRGKKDDNKKKYEPPILTRVGKGTKKSMGPDAASKLPLVTPHTHCRLKLLKQERIKDYLLMEEFIRNQEKVEKAPQETCADIGGQDSQIQEIKESVELPLTHPEYVHTCKILLAKAVANQTSATFLRVVGSELIQKYQGDRPKLVRELFRVVEPFCLYQPNPTILTITGSDLLIWECSDSGGEREIQRTMLELLNQMDGFDSRGDVKVIMAPDRIETLDPAFIRPGRIDRKIEFPLPDEKTKRRIFNIHASRMTVADDVTLDDLILAKDDLSAICTEEGLMALRERRMEVTDEDFKKSCLDFRRVRRTVL
uniref:ATPase AAA-type core domain-containing protein n=1 Tax=Oncorhynchus kisutch TaxID=8019 RepID=A0A8C7FEH3_ONCKI